MPPSDAYVRSFLYLLYTLIKLYYTHTQKKTKSQGRRCEDRNRSQRERFEDAMLLALKVE